MERRAGNLSNSLANLPGSSGYCVRQYSSNEAYTFSRNSSTFWTEVKFFASAKEIWTKMLYKSTLLLSKIMLKGHKSENTHDFPNMQCVIYMGEATNVLTCIFTTLSLTISKLKFSKLWDRLPRIPIRVGSAWYTDKKNLNKRSLGITIMLLAVLKTSLFIVGPLQLCQKMTWKAVQKQYYFWLSLKNICGIVSTTLHLCVHYRLVTTFMQSCVTLLYTLKGISTPQLSLNWHRIPKPW